MNGLPIAALDAFLRWVHWFNEARDGGLTKTPYDPKNGHKAKSDDPATWGSKVSAQYMAHHFVGALGGGIGFMLGDLGNGCAVGGIDLDTCLDSDGSFLPWATEVMRRLGSYCEISPSRTGAKIFFLYDPADLPALRAMMKTLWGKSWKIGDVRKHPPGIEMYLGNRYFAVTGEQLDLGPAELRPVPLETLRWLVELAGPAMNKKTLRAPASNTPGAAVDLAGLGDRIAAAAANHPLLGKRWGGDWTGLNDGSRSGMAMALGAALKGAGFSFSEMCAAIRQHPDLAEWAITKGAEAGDRELYRIFDRADPGIAERPDLIVHSANLPATVLELRDIFATRARLYDRGGVPVFLRYPADGGLPTAQRLTKNMVVMLAHELCRPVQPDKDGHQKGVTLPDRVGNLYLDLPDWKLMRLAGITSAPLLQSDGSIIGNDGYDARLGILCAGPPELHVPEHPSRAQAEAALALLRETFRTFPFKDSPFVERDGFSVVDTSKPAMPAEASFLTGLMTAVCRPSLWTAPGLLLTGPEVTGSGAGKGLLVRSCCAIAYGIRPAPFTAGHDRHELDKRLVAELIEAGPVVFLDNANGAVLKSDMLASVMTERPARVRVMGLSQMVPLNCACLIAITGNGLFVSGDLARRFLTIQLDPQCEDAERRPFAGGFLETILARRAELLTAVLTIWRWGRQNELKPGLPLASYEEWAQQCRDPLIALGCADPVAQMQKAKQADPQRTMLAELFALWRKHHGRNPVTVAGLNSNVAEILDPHARSRQFRTYRLNRMIGTRIDGYVLTKQEPAGEWNAATYALLPATAEVPEQQAALPTPMHPMGPMPRPLAWEDVL